MNPGNLYLVGMMGSGKSAVGVKLAKLLNLGFVDLDKVIESQTHQKISDIFASKGEEFFRELESKNLKSLSADAPKVVATGGGVIEQPENINVMKMTGSVVFLEASLPVLIKRLEGTTHRPLLRVENWKAKLAEISNERQALYQQAADVITCTDGNTAEQSAEAVYKKVKSKYASN